MNILYVWQSSFPPEIRIEKIAGSLSQHSRVHIACKNQNQSSKVFSMTEVKSAAIPFHPSWILAIAKIIETERIDLIIARDILVAPASIIAANSRIPVILDMAENYPEAMRGWKKYNNSFLSRFAVHRLKIPDFIERWSVKRCAGIWVVCEEQKQRLLTNYSLLNPNKIAIVSNTPTDHFMDEASHLKLPRTAKKFAYHGAITPERGLAPFIEGFIKATLERPNIEFHIYGRGESLPGLKKQFETKSNNIFFHGGFSPADYLRLIEKCDVGVIPHLQNEFINTTIPNKIFEYMATGRPILSSKAKPLARIIEKYRCGFTMDIGSTDSICRSIVNITDIEIANFGESGRIAVKNHFNWSMEEKVMLESIRTIVKPKGSSK